MSTKNTTLITNKLIEFELCSPYGEKIRNCQIQYYNEEKPIPDEKWLTLTENISNLENFKILANKAIAEYLNWQDVLKKNTIYDLVKTYEKNDNAEINGVTLKKILERERDNARFDNVMALFSSIVYLNECQIKDFLKTIGFDEKDILIINDKKNNIQVLLFRFKINEKETLIIHVWRGTVVKSIKNWRINLYGILKPIYFNNIKLHYGIGKVLKESLPKILDFINSDPNQVNVLTGHSLGGGLANASVPYLFKNNNKIARLTTFGAENSLQGTIELEPKITGGASRWISHSDPVPHCLSRFDVIGTVFHFNNDYGPKYIKNQLPDLCGKLCILIKSLLDFKESSISHHNLDCYLFKTRHLAEYLTHVLKGEKEDEYYYKYPYPVSSTLLGRFKSWLGSLSICGKP